MITDYLKHLAIALTGRNPYRVELDDLKGEYCRVLRMECDLRKLYEQASTKMREDDKRILAYQNMTENLRNRITDKDIALDEQKRRYENAVNTMRKQHKMRVEELETENAQLREDRDYALNRQQEVTQELAHECMANVMIERTNGWADDLYAALVRGDTEKLAAIGERDELGSRYARIAQQMVTILRRRDELEKERIEESKHQTHNYGLRKEI